MQQLIDSMPMQGVGRIVILNVPNVGITPRAIADSKQELFEELSIAYNEGIAGVVASLNDHRLVLVDFFALTNDAATNPQIYGLSNVTERCWDETTATVCINPDEYLFWDDIHPTAMGHMLLMLNVLEALTEPVNVPVATGYTWLLLLILGGLASARYYRIRLALAAKTKSF